MIAGAPSSLESFDAFENLLIQQFKLHPIFQNILNMQNPDFLQILCQRRFVSLIFTPVYDMAIDNFTGINAEAQKTAKQILQEEYPLDKPSHREDLVADLVTLGAKIEDVVTTQPSAATARFIQETFSLFSPSPNAHLHQIKVLTILRFWGEVLVATEYECLWPRMLQMGLDQERSLFYWEHYEHDKKSYPIGTISQGLKTHSDRLLEHLETLLDDTTSIQYCCSVESAIIDVKRRFYDQFVA